MNSYSYKKLDAFASETSSGNPAACFFLEAAKPLPHETMLAVAKQHKGFVSEVVFCRPSNEADYELIYYSSECEVDFCGHGTVACMYSLITSNRHLWAKPELLIKTKKGLLTVYNEIEKQNAVFIAAPAPVCYKVTTRSQEIAAALGTQIDNLSSPVGFYNAGLNTLIVPDGTLPGLLGISPLEQQLKAFCIDNGYDIVLIFSKETQSAKHLFHTRVFAPRFGYLEDPATGSGNSAFGCYLLENKFWSGGDILIEQGAIPHAFNTIHLKSAGKSTVLFGGSAVTRIEGVYFI